MGQFVIEYKQEAAAEKPTGRVPASFLKNKRLRPAVLTATFGNKKMITNRIQWPAWAGSGTLWLWAAFACLFLGACDQNEIGTDPVTDRVVLVYLAGDNNLSDETYQKKEALKQGWDPSLRGRLLIYSDPKDDVPKLLEIGSDKGGNTTETIVKTYGESNSADAAVFASVIREVKAAYPASSYGLVLFSHASGWLPQGTLTKPRSITIDQKDEMDLVDFAAAIPDHTFDFIVFEACFTAGIEMAYELKDKTNYILASSAEILSPGFTGIYADALAYLFSPQADLKAFAGKAFSYFNGQDGDYRSATFSIIRTDKLQPLAEWVKNTGVTLPESNIGKVQHFDRNTSYRLFFDFLDSYRQTLTATQSAELERLVGECVIYRIATPWFMPVDPQLNGFEIKAHSGLTTYIRQERFPFLNNGYNDLAWTKAIGQRIEK